MDPLRVREELGRSIQSVGVQGSNLILARDNSTHAALTRYLPRVNAWYSGPIFWSHCFFSIPHCIARSIKNTLDISSTF
jgi:hypothetical protein